MGVMPTGAGKTMTFTDIMRENVGMSVAIAHRSELISQMSLALARNGMQHRVIGQSATASTCRAIHLSELNRNYVSPHARCAVASVQTLIGRDANEAMFKETTLVVIDEGHHCLSDNAWGKAAAMFPNARILTVTATPGRADGKGLGRHADGITDVMVMGPMMRDLINDGYLTDYRLICPPSDLDLSDVPISAGGDFSPVPLARAVHRSHIVGDVVRDYLKFAAGKLGVTFATDIDSATDIATAYRAAGVAAEVITGKTPPLLRANLMHRFRTREVTQLISVEVLGEGVDVPAIEVVSMARPTQSLGLYIQQFGRGLRPMEGKGKAIIIDHVGNWIRHRLPDSPRKWTLDRRERRIRDAPTDVIPLRVCAKCLSAYERVYVACPFCGETPVPADRSAPDAVDGDLAEMDAELLARLRGEIAAVDLAPKIPFGAAPIVVASINKRHRERIEALNELKRVAAIWGGWRTVQGDTVPEQQRRFFHTIGTDILSAQSLGRAEAEALTERVRVVLGKNGVEVGDA
jgi:superfamily II DNA or RNA helicase